MHIRISHIYIVWALGFHAGMLGIDGPLMLGLGIVYLVGFPLPRPLWAFPFQCWDLALCLMLDAGA